MNPRPIQIEHPRRAAALSAGALMFHAVTEIDPNPVAGPAQTQAEIDIGLALPIPAVEPLDGTKSFRVHQGTTGMGCFDFYDAPSRLGDGSSLKFFPQL